MRIGVRVRLHRIQIPSAEAPQQKCPAGEKDSTLHVSGPHSSWVARFVSQGSWHPSWILRERHPWIAWSQKPLLELAASLIRCPWLLNRQICPICPVFIWLFWFASWGSVLISGAESGFFTGLSWLPACLTILGFLLSDPFPAMSFKSASSSRQVIPMLVKLLNARAMARVLAIRKRCLETLELQFCGLASPMSVKDSPVFDTTVALQMAKFPLSWLEAEWVQPRSGKCPSDARDPAAPDI